MFKILFEGTKQAIQELKGNKLRSILSLLGITIGIFCIITVKSSVDSLEDNIRDSFRKLGTDVLYLSKMPWAEDPFENYWKYMKRPNPSFKDYEKIKANVPSAAMTSFSLFEGNHPAKNGNNSADNAFVMGTTVEYGTIFNIQFEDGRFFSPSESNGGMYCCVIGHEIAEQLFPSINAVGRQIKVSGAKLRVVGVIKKSGKDIINPLKFDYAIILPYSMMKNVFDTRPEGRYANTSVNIKAKKGIDLEILRDESIAALRSNHRLHPRESNDFALNEISVLDTFIKAFFGVLNAVGFVIGGFSIFVGMFSVANIMFVSVKERTSIIGIKKALGAPRRVILLEFIVESIILCIIGGILGIIMVYIMVAILNVFMDYEIFLSLSNILLGLIISTVIGIVAGLIPAIQASKLDPVEAIRG